MSFSYNVTLTDQSNSSSDSVILAEANAAAARWSSYLSGLGTLDIEVYFANLGQNTAEGSFESTVLVGSDGPNAVYEPGTDAELLTGADPNGAAPDMYIALDTSFLADPSGITDLLTHEIGHGLGIVSYRDPADGSLSGYETTWDRLVKVAADGTAAFTGANAEAVYGGPVPVTTMKNGEQYAHLANSPSDAAASDLMNGLFEPYNFSSLDIAIMEDLGLTTPQAALETVTPGNASTPAVDTFRFFDTQDGGHFFTTSTTERDTVLATRPDMKFEGVGFQAYDAEKDGTAPVYRFFDTHDGGHFFTINPGERDTVLATRPDLKFEGIGYYESATSQGNNTDSVYRFFDTHDGGHFFTSSVTERDAVLATRPDLHFEGTAFYAPHLA